MALTSIYRGLHPELKYKCIADQCQTVAQAIRIVETHESIYGQSDRQPPPAVRMVKPQSNETGSIQASLNEIMDRLT